MKRDWNVFIASLFFVLGFSTVFSIVGVLLQSVLSSASYTIQLWLGRIGGIVIILFGLYMLGVYKPKFLNKELKISPKTKLKSFWLTSFVFGAAFAVGWTPCVGAVLGSILTLAVTQPGIALPLMMAYALGLGIPFIIVGLFTNQARSFIKKFSKHFETLDKIFGATLIGLGILVFTNQLARIANFAAAVTLVLSIDAGIAGISSTINIFIAFIAGIVSFLSPCVLPLLPGYLTYLASITIKER